MTENEIIKALECHSENSYNKNACEKCPILNHCDCGGKMAQNALELINSQKAEIKRYKNAYDQIKWERDMFEEDVQTAKAESNSLQAEIGIKNLTIKGMEQESIMQNETIAEELALAKTEAIKEFAERLKEKGVADEETGEGLVYVEDIDNLVKEMAGDNE